MCLESVKMEKPVFVSYRRLDDELPPSSRKDRRGFVGQLVRELQWELRHLGAPDILLWHDRGKIEPGDIWSDKVVEALNNAELFVAILSRNYIRSDWCKYELETMASRIAELDAGVDRRRIFRVDKHGIPQDEIPHDLRRVQAVEFYTRDDQDDDITEFYWRGKVRRIRDYEKALHKLANAIHERLLELGVQTESRRPVGGEEPLDRRDPNSSGNGRKVFLAKPADDMVDQYLTLVRELRGRGYRVTPDSEKELSKPAEVFEALSEAEASIHLLGESTGGRPHGFDLALVPMQLAAAADEATKRRDFVRMVWAPRVLLSRRLAKERDDAFNVVERFGARLSTDKIVNDTASRFNEYVLQHLRPKGRRKSLP
jgi:TIR domain